MKRIAIFALIALAGCQTQAQIGEIYARATPPSPALRAYLAEQAKFYLVDPYSVRDAAITSVNILDAKKGVTSLCIRGNAKNRMGGYSGIQTVSVRLVNDKAVASYANQVGCYDPRITWHPFPELEAL
ncbi:hypothetical protein [Pleomorphomonas sp. NRK KF1]|uniref:hypothetical protein n=1 Tax=Pleomorphomonas sp. NRK KF1 TaxID=2943000 RepID=UPI00204356E0|nr:hypothetical protein [Pleomorphomonas sp. NRK KF1]MCM5552402.1 hypothetical protein [Pleomorphomonas sp. NRK KF1]